jgi:hypothetical protein
MRTADSKNLPDPPFNREAYEAMDRQEREYLLANGWVQLDPTKDAWDRAALGREGCHQGHAVNIQKQYDRMHVMWSK